MALRKCRQLTVSWPLATVLATCLALAALAWAPSADARYSPRTALNDLNAMRAGSGLPRVSALSPKWNRGCKLHNRYMRRTGDFSHRQSRSSRYYSRLGSQTAARSVIAEPGRLPTVAFGGTIYHRLALLQPRLKRTGYSSNYGFTCLQVLGGISNASSARTPGVTTFAWPPNGSQSHAPVFRANEWPDPRYDAPGATQLGTPITFAVNGPWKYWQIAKSRVTTASLTSELGQSIAVSVSDVNSPNGLYLQGGFALLPRRGLASNTWFTATAGGVVEYQGYEYPFTASTRFRTGVDDGF